jgi:hypothetical protein
LGEDEGLEDWQLEGLPEEGGCQEEQEEEDEGAWLRGVAC